jgi:Fe2+ or Zn2+ uptake regulation protein
LALDGIRELFAQRGLRCTRQRELLYEALAECRTHPTAEELFHAATVRGARGDSGEALSLATVYNTLDAFLACGLARRIACQAGPARFDADMSEHAHICTTDGRLVDLPHDLNSRLLDQIPPSLMAEVERRLGVRVAGVSVQVIASGRPLAG